MEVLKIAGIKIQNLYKTYHVQEKEVPVLRGLELTLDTTCITVILGKSGCGKTTFLRVVSGLESMDDGTIEAEKTEKMGIVFQEPRLMPWLTIWQNITFGLKRNQVRREEIVRLIEMTGLTGFEKAYPAQLSGGMQQRAALARVLAYDASYILMDEPFAALDYFTRKAMQDELLRIWKNQEKGVLFVTHSIDEALVLGHRILIFEDGICKKKYDLRDQPFPRNLLSAEMIEIKKDILTNIEGTEGEKQ